jgi:hypothetical protein
MTPPGLEPAIPGSVGRCLIHWATEPLGSRKVRGSLVVAIRYAYKQEGIECDVRPSSKEDPAVMRSVLIGHIQ